ncbi:MAG: hypothetical protein H7Y18_07635 [Clostridiaceae bacterium]|nr:hypothetical protein [Clostridiaceae bacterium]
MPNKNSGLPQKGSRFYLQQYMLNAKEELSELILSASPSLVAFIDSKTKIEWKSPLEKSEKPDKEEFYEYRDDFLEVLGLEEGILGQAKGKVAKFWSKNGPQWDGLATVVGADGEKGLLLIEAKAHPDETKSDIKAESKMSIYKIENSIEAAQRYYGIKPVNWTKQYYQLGNRIAFLYFMNEILHIPTWLVLTNFTQGQYITTTLEEWLIHYHNIYSKMGIKHTNHKLLNNIIQIFPNAKD